jgi:hypothetical protein
LPGAREVEGFPVAASGRLPTAIVKREIDATRSEEDRKAVVGDGQMADG